MNLSDNLSAGQSLLALLDCPPGIQMRQLHHSACILRRLTQAHRDCPQCSPRGIVLLYSKRLFGKRGRNRISLVMTIIKV